MTEPMMKGALVREFLDWYESEHGTARIRTVVERLPPELRALLDPDEPMIKLLPSSWYPARLTHIALDVIAEGMNESAIERMVHEATRVVVAREVTSVYRFALRRIITPELYALSVKRLWRQLHTTGDREVRISGSTATSKVSNWDGHHPILCTITIETMCAIFEKMGKTNVTWKRTSCVARGGKECVTELSWA